MSKSYYQTKIVNKDGLKGKVYVVNGISVPIDSPFAKKSDHANPEQFLGMALATCLNSTVQYILKRDKMDLKSVVEVTVDLHIDESTKTYYFNVLATLGIESLSLDETMQVLKEAETRCPVAKMLDKNYMSLNVVKYEELNDWVS